jgi:WD40 repeat protein
MGSEDKDSLQGQHSEQQPELYALTRRAGGYRLNRRDFLAAAAAAAGCVALGGCLSGGSGPVSTALDGNKLLVSDWAAVAELKAHTDGVKALAFSPDGKLLASGSQDGSIRLWSLPGGRLQATPKGLNEDSVYALAISPDGKLLASGSAYATTLRSLPEGKWLATRNYVDDSAYETLATSAVGITPDGNLLVSGHYGSCRIWSLPGCELQATLPTGRASYWRTWAVAISPDGTLLASGSQDGSLKLWSLPEGKLQATLTAHEHGVRAVTFTPDGRLLASGGGYDETIKLWSLPQGKLQTTLTGHKHYVSGLAISPDGKLLASGSNDDTIELWSLPEGKLRTTLTGHNDSVNAVAFAPDGKRLASGGGDGLIILWELEGQKRQCLLVDPAAWADRQAELRGYDERTPLMRGSVCTCDQVCSCNAVWSLAGTALPVGAVCVCNTVRAGVSFHGSSKRETTRTVVGNTCTCDKVCTCDRVCTCNTVSTGGVGRRGGGGGRICTCNLICTCDRI